MSLEQELLQMISEDQAMREALASTGELFKGYHPAMEKVHLRNAQRLQQLIEQNGFPDTDKVSAEACTAALRIVLHAISWPDFMRAQEQNLLDLAKSDKVPKTYVAMLVDRIRFYEGRKQIYGTNADWDENGILRITDIEDEQQLAERRSQMGLSPLKSLVITPLDGEFHPQNPKKRLEEFEAWTRKVGWRSSI